jgi:hypothetical protein
MKNARSPGRRRPNTPSQWTVMVFMVGGPELGPSLDRDILELERAGSSDEVRVVAAKQHSDRSNTEWLEIQPVDENTQEPRKSKTVGGSTQGQLDVRLQEFLDFAGKAYESRHYALILWAHASGLGFGRLGPGSSKDLIRLAELTDLLHGFRAKRESAQKLEILGFCACALSKAEFAIELSREVDFLVSSQVGISTLMTWPFDTIVRRMVMSPSVTPETLASQIVQCFEESYEPPPVALTALDLKRSEDIGRHVDQLATKVLDALATPDPVGRLNNLCVLQAFRKALAAYPFDLEPLVDFFDFCQKLVEEDALAVTVRAQARDILDRGSRAFVVNNTRSGPKLGALNGLSILAPDFDDPDWEATCGTDSAATHSTAQPWKSTRWVEMAQKVYRFALANPDLND